MSSANKPVPNETLSERELLWLGAAAGLFLGVVEVALRRVQTLAGGPQQYVSREVVWMAPLANLILVLTVFVGLVAVARWRKRSIRRETAFGFASFPLLFALALQFPRVHPLALLVLAAGLARLLAALLSRRTVLVSRPRRLALGLTGLVILVSASAKLVRNNGQEGTSVAADAERPNILLLVLDTVRAKSLGLYGYPLPTTPNLDSLATEGLAFENAWAPSPWTLPSHATMFTGRWDHELSVDFETPLDDTYPTIAEVLAEHGYQTAGFVANLDYTTYEVGLDRGFQVYDDYPVSPAMVVASSWLTSRVARRVRNLLGVRPVMLRKSADQINSELLDWVDSKDSTAPFFAFLNYFDAHAPIFPPDSLDGRFGPVRSHPFIENLSDREFWTEAELESERAAYDAAIAYLDGEIGTLLSSLDSRGLLRNTIVVVTSDHGEQFGEHGLTDHANSLYSSVLHVPLVIIPAGGSVASRRISRPVSLRDLPATLLSMVGVADHPLPGQVLPGVQESGESQAASPLLAELRERIRPRPWFPVSRGPMRSIRSGDWQLIVNGDGAVELYDLAPGEHSPPDQAGTEPAVTARLRSELEAVVRGGPDS